MSLFIANQNEKPTASKQNNSVGYKLLGMFEMWNRRRTTNECSGANRALCKRENDAKINRTKIKPLKNFNSWKHIFGFKDANKWLFRTSGAHFLLLPIKVEIFTHRFVGMRFLSPNRKHSTKYLPLCLSAKCFIIDFVYLHRTNKSHQKNSLRWKRIHWN